MSCDANARLLYYVGIYALIKPVVVIVLIAGVLGLVRKEEQFVMLKKHSGQDIGTLTGLFHKLY